MAFKVEGVTRALVRKTSSRTSNKTCVTQLATHEAESCIELRTGPLSEVTACNVRIRLCFSIFDLDNVTLNTTSVQLRSSWKYQGWLLVT